MIIIKKNFRAGFDSPPAVKRPFEPTSPRADAETVRSRCRRYSPDERSQVAYRDLSISHENPGVIERYDPGFFCLGSDKRHGADFQTALTERDGNAYGKERDKKREKAGEGGSIPGKKHDVQTGFVRYSRGDSNPIDVF